MSASMPSDQRRRSRFLNSIEWLGNKLPEPMIIFLWLILLIAVVSAALAAAGVSVIHPDTGEDVPVRSLLSGDGLVFVLEDTVSNFVGFAPVGTVLTIMLGIGLADRIGLLGTLIRAVMLGMPAWLLPYAVFLVANAATIAADAAFLIMPPLAAIVYRTLGRNPLVGIVSAFAGSSSGYGSGFLITSMEPMLAGITNEAVAIIGDGPVVTAVDNYFFMVAAALLCTLVGGSITRWIVEPRFGAYTGEHTARAEPLTTGEKRGLWWAGTAAALYIGLVAVAALVPDSPLQNEDGGLVPSPLLSGVVPILLVFFTLVALAYGFGSRTLTSGRQVVEHFAEAIGGMRFFLVVIFVISQFSAYFNWSNIGLWVSVNGAEFLVGIGATGVGVLVGVTVISALITLLITSGTGLWAILAPIFVPMFMQLGFHPAAVQMAYRIGDSSTSMVTPLMPYMIVILGFMREWDRKQGLGNVISATVPYAIGVFVAQSALFLVFYWLGLPLGPGVGFRLD
jgi:aminobenzoyl-glutamate transport protein